MKIQWTLKAKPDFSIKNVQISTNRTDIKYTQAKNQHPNQMPAVFNKMHSSKCDVHTVIRGPFIGLE